MAGGYGTGSGVPLRDRVRAGAAAPQAGSGTTPHAEPPPARDRPAADDGPGPYPGRHCWVSLPVDGPRPRPALLIEWRRADRGRWEGRVAYVAELRPGRWALVEEWVPAELLTAPP